MAKKNTTAANETILREIFGGMDAHDAQEIRDAYYKAAEGLYALAETLEAADAKSGAPGGELINEHLIACEAIEAIRKSRLGSVL